MKSRDIRGTIGMMLTLSVALGGCANAALSNSGDESAAQTVEKGQSGGQREMVVQQRR